MSVMPRCKCLPAWKGTVINAKVFSRRDQGRRSAQIEEKKRLASADIETKLRRERTLIKECELGKPSRCFSTGREANVSAVDRRPAASGARFEGRADYRENLDAIPSDATAWGTSRTQGNDRTEGSNCRGSSMRFVSRSNASRRRVPGEDRTSQGRRRASAGRHQDGEGLRRHQTQALRSATRWPDATETRASCREILPEEDMPYLEGWHAGRYRAQSAGCAVAYERGAGPRDPPRLGGVSIGRQLSEELDANGAGCGGKFAMKLGDLRHIRLPSG